MKDETIKIILRLLERVQLQGSEVPIFNQVVQELNQELKPKEKNENVNKE